MKELRNIFTQLEGMDDTRHVGLATVVKVNGSSYRNVGAKMLVTGNGRWTGGLSGGCLEGDALRKMRHVIETGISMTHTYDTSKADGGPIGAALGCNGIIDVLFEPFVQNATLFARLRENLKNRKTSVIGYVFSVHAEGMSRFCSKFLFDGELRTHMMQHVTPAVDYASCALDKGESVLCRFETGNEIFDVLYEIVHPPVLLHVFGGGRDVVPLTQIAHLLGWEVSVYYNCQVQMMTAGFDDYVILHTKDPAEIDIRFDARSPAVIMSHNYGFDVDALAMLAENKDIPYLGVLGPRKRTEKMLGETGKQPTERVFFPAGLDLDADGAEEIALSIIAEIQSVLKGTEASSLRDHAGPIHDRRQQRIKTVAIDPVT